VRDAGELVAAVPVLLGFHPRRSLVVVGTGGTSGRRVGLTLRVDLPPPRHVAEVSGAVARQMLLGEPTGAAVIVVDERGAEAGPPRRDVAEAVTAALGAHGVVAHTRVWAAGTAAGAAWACFDACCAGTLPDPATTPLAATAVAAGAVVLADRGELERLVAPVPATVLRRRERLLTRAVDAAVAVEASDSAGSGTATAVVDAALADTAAGRLQLDDGRVLALALALAEPAVRDAALERCAADEVPAAEQLWAALVRETPDPEAAEPAALLAACALLRGDGALAGIALDRAERAWPGHRLTGLLRAVWAAGMRPEQVRGCLLGEGPARATRGSVRRGGRR
jgi:hypothetical protein